MSLARTISRWCQETAPREPSVEAGVPSSLDVELEALFDDLGRDREVFEEIIATFRVDSAEGLAVLTAGARAGDLTEVRHHAHRLKGAMASVRAFDVMALVAAIEDDAAAGSLADLLPRVPELAAQADLVSARLAAVLTRDQSPRPAAGTTPV